VVHLVVTRNATVVVTAYLNGAVLFTGSDSLTMNIANDILIAAITPAILRPSAFRSTARSMSGDLQTRLECRTKSSGIIKLRPIRSRVRRTHQHRCAVGHERNQQLGLIRSVRHHQPRFDQPLKLRIQYDDGFTAYINGQSCLPNAPEALDWNSTANARHADGQAVLF